MQLALVLGIPVAGLLASLGARVLRRAGGFPDRMVGVFFVCMGLGAMPALLAPDPSVFPPPVAPWAMGIGHGVVSVGFAALYLFAWRCFGADSPWRRAFATAALISLAGLWVAQGLVERFEPPGGPVLHTTAFIRAFGLAWAFSESIRYSSLLRRRAEVGLADPVVANRFLLWCMWTGGMLGCISIAITVRLLMPAFGEATPPAQRIPIVLGFLTFATAAGFSLWLAFFPPRWYLARLRPATS